MPADLADAARPGNGCALSQSELTQAMHEIEMSKMSGPATGSRLHCGRTIPARQEKALVMSPVLFADHLRTFRNARRGEGFRPGTAGLLLVIACLAGFAMLTFQTTWLGGVAPQARAAAQIMQERGQ